MKKRIMVVDDDRANRELLRDFLEESGFDVITASDGAEGMELFDNTLPDVVLTDLEMPKCNGLALTSHIKSVNRSARNNFFTPVILMSGNSALLSTKEKENEADQILHKPIRTQEVLKMINICLCSQ